LHNFNRTGIKKSAKALAEGDFSEKNINDLHFLRKIRSNIFPIYFIEIQNALKNFTYNFSGRLKRFETILRKLRRQSSDVTMMADIIGYRIIVPSISQQELIINNLKEYFNKDFKDYRSRKDGYRAVHFNIEIEKDENGIPQVFEIQVRTIFQNIWSNYSESYGEIIKEVKSSNNLGSDTENIVKWLSLFSKKIYEFEEKNLDFIQNQVFLNLEKKKYFLFHYNKINKRITAMDEYSNMQQAIQFLDAYESLDIKNISVNKNKEIILALSASIDELKVTHPRFFNLDGRPIIPDEIFPGVLSPI
jgi:ppGpp synthetase/RelA/SpoT-type nucleotidyltranferase